MCTKPWHAQTKAAPSAVNLPAFCFPTSFDTNISFEVGSEVKSTSLSYRQFTKMNIESVAQMLFAAVCMAWLGVPAV